MSVPGEDVCSWGHTISFVHVYRYRCIVLKYSAVLGNSWELVVLGNNILVYIVIYLMIDIMLYKYLIYLNIEKKKIFLVDNGKLTTTKLLVDNSENSALVGEVWVSNVLSTNQCHIFCSLT